MFNFFYDGVGISTFNHVLYSYKNTVDVKTFSNINKNHLQYIVSSNCVLKFVKNSHWSDPTHPPAYPIFFLKQFETWKQHKKHNISNKKSEFGLDPPTHFRVFLGFLIFFNLAKPLIVCLTISHFVQEFEIGNSLSTLSLWCGVVLRFTKKRSTLH